MNRHEYFQLLVSAPEAMGHELNLIYQNALSNMACDARSWSEYGIWLAIGLFVCFGFLLSYMRFTPTGWKRTVFMWGAGLCLLFVPLFAIVPALSVKTNLVYSEGLDFVRIGCRGSHPFEDRHPLASVTASYVRTVSRGSETHSLQIRWPGQTRKFMLRLSLNDPQLSNLFAFAPGPMEQYMDMLRSRGIEIPAHQLPAPTHTQ